MYACNTFTLDQLLSLRDGEPVDAGVQRHVETCVECAHELARLQTLKAKLQSLPSLTPPAYNGAGIRARLNALRVYRVGSIAAAASVSALTLLLISFASGPRATVTETDTAAAVQTAASTTEVEPPATQKFNSLVIRSQELESRLQRLPRRPRIERASTSATIDTLQDRIQWVDYQLSLAHDVGMSERQSARLWESRVQLMDSLLQVRYAEAQRSSILLTSLSRSSP